LRLRIAFAGALALTLAAGATGAFAQNAQDDDEWLDTKIFRGFLKELGLQGDENPIEYRERAPLVVPPSRTLPPPRSESAAAKNPAWPKDPDAKKRQDVTATPAQRARLSGDRVTDNLRPLAPNELERGRSGPRPTGDNSSAENDVRPMSPSSLGYSKGLWEMFMSNVGPERPEYAPFQGEAPRTSLTAPPTGYQTPSPAQPYGLSPTATVNKPMTLEDRVSAAPK
jgi:hypothetical protein